MRYGNIFDPSALSWENSVAVCGEQNLNAKAQTTGNRKLLLGDQTMKQTQKLKALQLEEKKNFAKVKAPTFSTVVAFTFSSQDKAKYP